MAHMYAFRGKEHQPSRAKSLALMREILTHVEEEIARLKQEEEAAARSNSQSEPL